MNEIYSAAQGFAGGLMTQFDADPLEIAAVFSAIALQIYKSSLSEEEFNEIVDVISDSRREVRPFEPFVNWNAENNIIH
jgi:hypothetical protein